MKKLQLKSLSNNILHLEAQTTVTIYYCYIRAIGTVLICETRCYIQGHCTEKMEGVKMKTFI